MLKNVWEKIRDKIDFIFIVSYVMLLLADLMYCHPLVEKYNNYIVLLSYGGMLSYILFKIVIEKKYKSKQFWGDKKIIIFVCVLLLIIAEYLFIKDATFLRLFLLIACIYFMNFKKFIAMDLKIKILLIILTVSMCFTGIIQNEVFLREDGYKRYSLGFKNPNLISLYLTAMIFEIAYITKYRRIFLVIAFCIFVEAMELLALNTKTALIIIPIAVIFFIIYKKWSMIIEKVFENKFVKFIIYASPILLTVSTFVLVYMFDSKVSGIDIINKAFSGRIQLFSLYLKEFGISIFGNKIPDIIQGWAVLDNVYLKLLIKFGVIQYGVYVCVIFLNLKSLYKQKQYGLIFSSILLQLYGMMETIVMISSINVFMLYFASKKKNKGCKDKVYICEGSPEGEYNASTKARSDVERILEKEKFKKYFIPTKHGVQQNKLFKVLQVLIYLYNYVKWDSKIKKLEDGTTVVIQYPLVNTTLLLKNVIRKNKDRINFIAIIHDLDSLRYKPEIQGKMLCKRVQKEDKEILNECTYIIAHNNKMKDYLITLGNDESKILVLNLFDYLVDIQLRKIERRKDDPIIIAGNLSKDKAEYLRYLSEIPEVHFNLYGKGYSKEEKEKNIEYKGAFLPEELLNNLEGSFGLVWDGNSKDSCQGGFGEYLRYNNPHKVSMYLAAGIPVIIWKEAALADFIENNKLGFTISNLNQIGKILDNLTNEEYEQYIINVNEYSMKVKKGDFLNKVIDEIIKD